VTSFERVHLALVCKRLRTPAGRSGSDDDWHRTRIVPTLQSVQDEVRIDAPGSLDAEAVAVHSLSPHTFFALAKRVSTSFLLKYPTA
jgi:hypothetical protein